MAKTISELRNQSIQVRDASAAGENTATRVGTVLNDIVGHIEDYENTQSSNNSSQDAKIEGVKSSLNAEIARAKTEESNLSTQIGTERTERQAAVSREETARIQADNDEKTARQQADNAEQDARIKADNDEKTARENADITLRTMIQTEVSNRQIAVKQEEIRAMVAEQTNAQAIEDENARATTAEAAETARAKAEEERLQREIDNTNDNLNSLDDKVNSNNDHFSDEVARLDTTDNEIKADLEAETTRAEAAEEANAKAITDEAARAQAAEQAIIFDVSAHNNGAVFESLQALLSSPDLSTLIPTSVRYGGMSIRFIQGSEQGSDNKYEQYRLMSDTFNTIPANWQSMNVDDEPTVESNNLIKSGGVYEAIQRLSFIVWYNEFSDVPNEGGYISFYGDVLPFANARYTDYIRITPGKTYFIKRPFIADNAALAIYDANKNFIRSIDASALSDGNLTFIANENEYYIRVSFVLTGGFPKYISLQNESIIGWIDNDSVTTPKIKDGAVTLPKLSDSVKDIFSVANTITTDNTQSGYINNYGQVSSFNRARATDYLLVKNGVPVVILNPFVNDLASIALYDETKTVTRIISYSEIGVNPETAIVIPNENESYLRVSFLTTKIPNVIYYAMDKSTFPGSVFEAHNVIDGGYINNVGNVNEFPSGNFAYTDYIVLPQGIQFKVVNKTIDFASFAIYNSDKSVSRIILSSDVSGQEYIDFTLSGDEKYIRATLRTGDICNVYFNEIITKCDILKRIETTQVQTKKQYNVLAAFNNIVCVGDSLTFSQVYTAQSVSRQANRPYPMVLGKLCGNDTTILARAGATAQMCWNEFGSQIVTKTNPLAIIYLGTNYGLTDTLETDVVGNDTDNWADNNIGCYCRFVQKFKSLGYKVLLLKCWATSGTGTANLENTNSAIKHIGERFGCSVMDVPVSSDLKYHYYPDLSGYNGIHYNDLGYSWFASALISAVSDLKTDEMKFIIPNH